jgi:hypothetical protein
LALLAGLLPACGGGNPEVWLALGQDGSKPCLGAAHMEIQIIYPDGVEVFHEFGQFFNGETHACAIGEFRFSGLTLGKGIQVSVSMWDSTSDTAGQLATGSSLPVNVTAGSPTTQLEVDLARTDAPLGTIIVPEPPPDWANVSGIDTLTYRVTAVESEQVLRSGFFSYSPEMRARANPFPLLISGLELFGQSTELQLVVEAKRGQDLVRSWTAAAYLGGNAPNPAYAQLP